MTHLVENSFSLEGQPCNCSLFNDDMEKKSTNEMTVRLTH